MLGVEVSAEESHTIRASDNKDNTNAGLSSGQLAGSQASNPLTIASEASIEKPASGACEGSSLPDSGLNSSNQSTVVNKKKVVPLYSPLRASDPRLAAYTRGRIIEGSRAGVSDSQSGVLPKAGIAATETSTAASRSKLTIAATAFAPAASDPGGMRETPTNEQTRSEAVVPARGPVEGSKATVQSCVEPAASASTPPSVPELKIRDSLRNTQDISMAEGAAPDPGPGSKAYIKSGTGTSASTEVSVDGGSTGGATTKVVIESASVATDSKPGVGVIAPTLAPISVIGVKTTASETEAAAPDTRTSSEIGYGRTASTSAPTSVPRVRTGSGPIVSNPGATTDSSDVGFSSTSTPPSIVGIRVNGKSGSTQAESVKGGSTLGSRADSKAAVGVEGKASLATWTERPVLGSSSAALDVATNATSTVKGGTSEPRSSLKQSQQRVLEAVPLSMTDVVDALSGPLSARRTTQASVATALDSRKGIAQNESGPRVSENEMDIRGNHEDEAFRTRLAEELITMMKAMGGSCKMSTIASKYRRIFRRQLFLGGRKLRHLLENDGGLAGIILEDSADGGVIRLDSPTDSNFTSSGMKLTRTILNKKALKHGGHSSLKDGSSGRTVDTSKTGKTLAVNAFVRPDSKSVGCESPVEDGLERRDSKRLPNKPQQSSTKSSGASDRAPTSSKTSLLQRSAASRKDHPQHPASTTTIRERDRVKPDKKVKDETKTKRGRSPGRSQSYDSRYLEGRPSTKRDRTRDESPKQSRDLVDGRVFKGKYAYTGLRRDKRGERIRQTRSTRSRSKSVNLRRARSDSRSPNSYGSSGRSADSQSLARSRHGRKRSEAGVSSDRRYDHERGQSGMDRGLPITAVRVKHEEHASSDETISRKGYRQQDYPVHSSTREPARGSNFRGDFSNNGQMSVTGECFPYVGPRRDFRRDEMRGEAGDRDVYHGASKGDKVFGDRRGVQVESGTRSNKRRLTDGVADAVFHDAHVNGDFNSIAANGDRPTKRYAATALGRGIGGHPSNEGAALRGEWAVHADDGVGRMRTDVPARALLPSSGTIQPVPLSVDRPQGARLIIKGTHPAVPERRIHALASAYGTVGKIEVLEGFVFVHMKYLEEAERAVVGLSGRLLPNVSAGRNAPLMAAVWREEMYQALMSRDNMRRYADCMRKASTWYEKHKNVLFEGQAEVSIPCRFFALGRGCVFGNNCEFIHENSLKAGVMGDALGRSAIGNGAPPDPLVVSSSMPPGRREIEPNRTMVSGEHPVVRHRVPVDGSREEHSRDVFVQSDEQHSRPPTGIRGRQKPEPSGGMDVVPSVGLPGSWRSEHRRPEQTHLPRAHTGFIGHTFDGMRAETRVDPYRGECSVGYIAKSIDDQREQEYRSVNQGHQGVIPGSESEHVAKRHHSRSPRRSPYKSRERAFSRHETTRDGASRHGSDLDAIDDVHFDFRRSSRRGRERTGSRSNSMEAPRSRGRITRRNSYDAVHRYEKTDRRDHGLSHHERDTDILALDRRERDFYRRDHGNSRRSRDVSPRDRGPNRRGRSDGRRERDDSRDGSRSESGGRYHRDNRGGRRDGMERGRDHDKKRRPVRGDNRHGSVRDGSKSSKERFDGCSESRIGDRGQRRDHSRSLSNRGRRAPSHDEGDRKDGVRARATENRMERDDQRGSRREGREQEVVFSGLRGGDGYEDYGSGRSSHQALQDHRDAGNDGMLNGEAIGQEFPDFDDELMGDSKAVGDDGQVKTTFTVTACLDPQSPQREAVSPPNTTFSVTMPLDPTDVLKYRPSRDEGQGGKQGRGRGARGGRGTRGRGGRGGRGSYQQRDGAYQDV